MTYYAGIDLGGSAIKGGVIDGDARVLASRSIPTENDRGVEHVLDRMAKLANELVREAGLSSRNIEAVGIGTPGPIDATSGTVLLAPNLGWKNVPLDDEMSRRLPWNVHIVNDADAAAVGEFRVGAGREVMNMILLTIGTGIGSGVILNGELFSSRHGGGAELGHVIIEKNGRPCGCGQHGCVEQYASASAIADHANQSGAKEVFDAAQAGDVPAMKAIEQACDALAVGCVNYVHAFDPELIVLGGGVASAGRWFVDRVRERFESHYWQAAPSHVRFEPAKLGNDAGFIGAATLARN